MAPAASTPPPPSVTAIVRAFCVAAREGRVPDGGHVRQRDLMSFCGATRAHAQSALAILRHQGLLVPDSRGRLLLRLPRRAEVEEIYVLRIALEQLIIELSMERLSDADLNRIRGSFVRLRTAIVEGHWDLDRAETVAFNALARITHWPMLVRMVSDLQHDLRSCRLLLEDLLAASTEVRAGEHLDVLWRAVSTRDVAMASRLLRTHIEHRAAWTLERLPETTSAQR